jgi:hypothetical protein
MLLHAFYLLILFLLASGAEIKANLPMFPRIQGKKLLSQQLPVDHLGQSI